LEIPRGAIDENDSLEETARHELIEEIGGEAGELIPLGFVYGSTNLFANGSYLYITHLKSLSGLPQLDEGVEAIEMLTIEEFETMMIQGKIEEAFTIAAFSQARLRGLV
jgi:ADP-ribose pyrophosphatase